MNYINFNYLFNHKKFKIGFDCFTKSKSLNILKSIDFLEPRFRIVAEIPLKDYSFIKLMTNNEKEIFLTLGKQYNNLSFSFETKILFKNKNDKIF